MAPGDIGAIAELEGRCFEEPWPSLAFEQFAGADGFLIAVDTSISKVDHPGLPDGRLAGYVVTTPASDGHTNVHVRNLAVAPERRRRGLGSRLLIASLRQYQEQGFDRARLEVRHSNRGAIDLYRGHDFEIVGREPHYYGDGEDAVIMARPLAALH